MNTESENHKLARCVTADPPSMGLDRVHYGEATPGYIPLGEEDSRVLAGYRMRRLDVSGPWYHGTSAPEFDYFRGSISTDGGVSFTRNIWNAEQYATTSGGIFKDILLPSNAQHEIRGSRVIEAEVNLPTRAVPHIEIDTSKYLDYAISSREPEFWVKVHLDAGRLTRGQGAHAYTIDHGLEDQKELVVLYPRVHVRIVNQNVNKSDIDNGDPITY